MIDFKTIERQIKETFPKFGPNKQQLIKRLLFEIAKREQIDAQDFLRSHIAPMTRFEQVKVFLLKRRFPNLTTKERRRFNAFPDVFLDPEDVMDIQKEAREAIRPQKFYVEKAVKNSPLVDRIRANCPNIPVEIISSYAGLNRSVPFTTKDYNHRIQNFFITKEKFDFFMPCPCTKNCVCCHYQILNLGMGCAFDCEYCYLQSYTNARGITLPANIDDYFAAIKPFLNHPMRIGTGQFTDSLLFDPITEYSKELIPFFQKYPHVQFEFKTKSDHIKHPLNIPASDNIVMAWSLNPQSIIDACEHFTATLDERLTAAQKCADHGYRIAFHFDPVIYYEGWENDYQLVIDQLFAHVPAARIAWISLGTLRMTTAQKLSIEKRFPQNIILNSEFLPGFDNKWRYSDLLRADIYKKMKKVIQAHSHEVITYLCMESPQMHQETGFSINPFPETA